MNASGSLRAVSITAISSRIEARSSSSTRVAASAAISGSRISRTSARNADPSGCPIFSMRSSDCRMEYEVPSVTNVPRPG